MERAYLAAELIADANAESAATSSGADQQAHVDNALEVRTCVAKLG